MLIVRCPTCHTVFRVRPEQLRAHGGRVRCGSCYGAFNAVEHLMDQERIADPAGLAEHQDQAPAVVRESAPQPSASLNSNPFDDLDFGIPETRPAAPPPPQTVRSASAGNERTHTAPAPDNRTSTWPALEQPDVQPPRTEFRPYVPPRPAPPPSDLFVRKPPATPPERGRLEPVWSAEPPTQPTPGQDEPVTLPVDHPGPDPAGDQDDVSVADEPATPPETDSDAPSPFVVRDEDPPLAIDADEVDDDTPAFLYRAEPQIKHRWLWGLMTGMLAGTLAVQAAYLFREDIARKWPQTRPWYLELCTHLGCALPLPRVASAITIESSNLESDPGDARQFVLSARVRNQAPHPQQYPHLELTLTDGRDRPVVRRVITPAEWVPGGVNEAGMAPRAEIEASVPFEATGPVSAVGYRVYAFYP